MRRFRPLPALWTGLLALATSLSCSGDSNHDGAEGDPALAALPTLRLGAPSLAIGEDGSAERTFSRIMARRFPDGDILVGDGASRDVRRFDRRGRFVRLLARRGNGPGEIAGEMALAMHADTIFLFGQVIPSPTRTIALVSSEGRFLRQFAPAIADADSASAPEPSARGMVVRDRLSTGEYLVEAGAGWRRVDRPFALGALVPDSVTLGVFTPLDSAGSGAVHWFERMVRGWLFVYPWIGGPTPTAARRYPFAPATSVVVSADLIWFGDAATGTIRAFDARGRLRAEGVTPGSAQPFDDDDFVSLRRELLLADTTARARARIDAMLGPAIRPAQRPRFSQLVAGHDGGVWVRLFDVDSTSTATYVVVDREARATGRVTLPPRVSPQQVGQDFLLAIRRDSLGIEEVVEYPLHRR